MFTTSKGTLISTKLGEADIKDHSDETLQFVLRSCPCRNARGTEHVHSMSIPQRRHHHTICNEICETTQDANIINGLTTELQALKSIGVAAHYGIGYEDARAHSREQLKHIDRKMRTQSFHLQLLGWVLTGEAFDVGPPLEERRTKRWRNTIRNVASLQLTT